MHQPDTKQMDLDRLLRDTFGFSGFRPGQREAVESLLQGRDVVVVMPTGGGKSLLYQLPAVAHPTGVTLVVSPLISLMKDQVDALNSTGISAGYSNSSQDELEQMRMLSLAVQGKIRLLYISPERAVSRSFLDVAERMQVRAIAVDEAHCISRWGYDFRPEYRELAKLRKALQTQSPPVIALTATATDRVMRDIEESLGLADPVRVVRSFFRPNLRFEVRYPENESRKESMLLEILESMELRKPSAGRAVIYCSTRDRVERVYRFLRENGFRAGLYHAGKSSGVREKAQNTYTSGKSNILVATNAFGMGLDQPDVRLVLHYQIPSSVESYYQEAGRAGRDGEPSRCILFYRSADIAVQSFIINKDGNKKYGDSLLTRMQGYVVSTDCRQRYICSYFGEEIEPCGVCDVCGEGESSETAVSSHAIQRQEFLEKEQKKRRQHEERSAHPLSDEERDTLREILAAYPGMYGKRTLASCLRGSKSKEIQRFKLHESPFHGLLKEIPEEAILHHFEEGVESGSLRVTTGKYPKLYLKDRPPMKRSEKREEKIRAGILKPKTPDPDRMLVQELRSWRDRTARRNKWKKFMVVQNAVLSRIATVKPVRMGELELIKGMGDAKMEKFGLEILEIVRKYI